MDWIDLSRMDFLQLQDKSILVMGVANRRSVAWAAAQVLAEAEVFSNPAPTAFTRIRRVPAAPRDLARKTTEASSAALIGPM